MAPGVLSKAARCVAMVIVLSMAGCAGKNRRPEESAVQTAMDRSTEEALRTAQLQKKYGAWANPRLKTYLDELAGRLRGSAVNVVLLDSPSAVHEAGLVSALYLSRGALSAVQFENELAFLLGRAIASFTLETPAITPTALDKAGVRLAYNAAYDPRGAVSLIERWRSNEGVLLPSTTYAERLRAVRLEIAKLSPLRDPIVSTPRFEEARGLISMKKGVRHAPRSTVN